MGGPGAGSIMEVTGGPAPESKPQNSSDVAGGAEAAPTAQIAPESNALAARMTTDDAIAGPRPMQAPPSWAPWSATRFLGTMRLDFHGSLETDVGYAQFTHDDPTKHPEEIYDFRGRFVLGPQLTQNLGSGYFFRGTAQFVAWMAEQPSVYQINVDDAYAQVGKKGIWDFAVGRFMTWRVYRKGLGYDLYTLEDTGASQGGFTSNQFYVHTYEVSDIFFRDLPEPHLGRAALHLYPTPWSGIELVGQYGNLSTINHAGGRAALGVDFGVISVAGAAEYQRVSPTQQQGTNDPGTGAWNVCDRCGIQERRGGGGGAVFKLHGVEVGVNGAFQRIEVWSYSGGTFDISASSKTQSYGGYLELDVGKWAVHRSFILGGGVNRTELLMDDTSWQGHTQWASYLAYPLGFNNAMVKLVLSEADGSLRTSTGDRQYDHMYAARVRVRFDF